MLQGLAFLHSLLLLYLIFTCVSLMLLAVCGSGSLMLNQSHEQARDAFYTCLDKKSDKKLTEIGSVGLLYPSECKKSRDEYVKQCRASWVCKFFIFFSLTKFMSNFRFVIYGLNYPGMVKCNL